MKATQSAEEVVLSSRLWLEEAHRKYVQGSILSRGNNSLDSCAFANSSQIDYPRLIVNSTDKTHY